MANVSKQKNSYDTVFDFIFQAQKEKVDKPIRKPHPSTGVYTSSLIEIGTQPTIYPLESVFNIINRYIAKESGIELSEGVSVGLGESIFGNPNTTISKTIAKNRAEANFARLGGNLHTGIDGALVSLLAKYNGVSSKTAYSIGRIYADLAREKMREKGGTKTKHLFGYQTEKDNQEKDKILYKEGSDLMVGEIIRNYPELDKGMFAKAISEGQRLSNYKARIELLEQRLKGAGITRVKDLHDITRYAWGDGGQDLGLYQRQRGEKEALGDKIERVLQGAEGIGQKERREEIYRNLRKDKDLVADEAFEKAKKDASEEFLDPDLAKDLQEIYKSTSNVERRNLEISNRLDKNGRYDKRTKENIIEGLNEPDTTNTGRDIAETSVLTSLAMSIATQARAKGDYATVAKAREIAVGILQDSNKSPGTQAARALLAYSWIKNSGAWGDILLNGNWEKFGVGGDLNFTNIMEEKKVMDEGKVLGSYHVPANSVMGKLIGNAYYLHPNNLIRGVFLDGSLWLKLADKGGKLNKKSLAYFLYEMRLGKLASAIAKPFNILTKKISGIVNPLVQGAKKLVKNLLKKIIGASGLAGFLINRLMDIFGDKIQEIVSQLVNIILLGILAILFILLESTGVLYSDEKVEGLSSSPNIVETEDLNIFTNEDYRIEP